MTNYNNFPRGQSIPANNPHAVSVSLPSFKDVIDYEEHDAELKSKMQSAYPRFRMNKYVAKVCDDVRVRKGIEQNINIVPVSSINSIRLLEEQFNISLKFLEDGIASMILIENDFKLLPEITSFIQHTGLIMSSRKAEDYLLNRKIIVNEFIEEKETDKSEEIIKEVLADAYGNVGKDDVLLCNCGMNAVFAALKAVKEFQEKKNKDIIVQLGWLYLDTMEIIRKYSNDYFQILKITDLAELETFLQNNKEEVAAVFTEVPTNPLVQTVDLPRLHRMIALYDIPLIVDSSVGTPFNVELLEYADIAVESLTKFACGHADLLMGAIILNRNSNFASDVKNKIISYLEKPYVKEIQRLAFEIKSYEQRVKRIAEKTTLFVEYLKKKKSVQKIHWALDESSVENYKKIQRYEGAVPGLISIIFDKDLKYIYDKLLLPKGPSFGTEFSLAMPYVYLAHYNLLQNREGIDLLNKVGINPELLRISVGLEPVDNLIQVFEEIIS